MNPSRLLKKYPKSPNAETEQSKEGRKAQGLSDQQSNWFGSTSSYPKNGEKKNKSITKILVSPVKEQEATIQPSYCGPRENYSQRFQRI